MPNAFSSRGPFQRGPAQADSSTATTAAAVSMDDTGGFFVSDDVEAALQQLAALTGVAAGDLGTFTGLTIPDGSNVKDALQALETSSEVADWIRSADASPVVLTDFSSINRGGLQGVAGTGTYGTATIASVLQAGVQNPASADPVGLAVFEGLIAWFGGVPYLWNGTGYTQVSTGGVAGSIVDTGNFYAIDTASDALQQLGALVGVSAGDLGTFTGAIIPDNSSIKGALQALETATTAASDWMGAAEIL